MITISVVRNGEWRRTGSSRSLAFAVQIAAEALTAEFDEVVFRDGDRKLGTMYRSKSGLMFKHFLGWEVPAWQIYRSAVA